LALYKLTTNNYILRTIDNAYIPPDLNNIDYQAYQIWLAEGNTPDPALTLAEAQTAQLNIINNTALTVLSDGFNSTATGTALWYDSDAESQLLYTNLYDDAKSGAYATTTYMTGYSAGVAPIRSKASQSAADSTKVVQQLTQAQFLQLYQDWKVFYTSTKAHQWTLQAEINAATTIAAVQAIGW